MPDRDYPEQIDLSNNSLKPKDILKFIQTLRNKITHLNLKNNKLGHKGCTYFADFISENPLTNCI